MRLEIVYPWNSDEDFKLFQAVNSAWGDHYSMLLSESGDAIHRWANGLINNDRKLEGSIWTSATLEAELWLMANAPPGYTVR